ncbi:MAG TPA: hypothetical protein VIY86_11480, partial [Pirellulaceae bacterium]
CKNQQRQIGLATLQFCDTHGGRFPQTMHSGNEFSWVYTLEPFLESVDAIRICPDDPKGAARLAVKSTSYVINEYLASNVPGSVRKLQKLKATSRTMVQFEGSDSRSTAFQNEHAHTSTWFSPLNREDGLVLYFIKHDLQLDRHMNGAHYLYADAHVVWLDENQIATWVDEDFEFARPE